MALFAAFALLLTACGTAGNSGSGSGGDHTLTIAKGGPPNSLDPAKISQDWQWYANLAYDPLIYRDPAGTLQPRLAESWGYTGAGNTVFELKLRPNVQFSDGSPLTADGVKASIEYYRKTHTGSSALSTVSAIDVTGPLTVRLTLSQPNPQLPVVFTQDYGAGNIIGTAALNDPAQLATTTVGAGPYVLDKSGTVANDHYAYVPNPHYWNKAAVAYSKVVVRVIPNPNTSLAALKTGQVDVIQGVYSTAEAAKSAGLRIASAPQVFVGLSLADRQGTLAPQLRDVRVRQALNYAVDRQKIAKALFGEYGTPTEQIVLPGQDGYNDNQLYTYDPAKAKQLLSDAGYPNGFTLPVVTTSSANIGLTTQAIADELKQVGVQLQLTNHPDAASYNKDVAGAKFPAYGIGFGTMPVYLMGQTLYLPSAAQFNPFKSSDPALTALYQQAAGADEATRAKLDQQIVRWLDEQAWFLPVVFTPVFFFSRTTVAGVQSTRGEPIANPTDWRPAS
ncbi:peptide/nickel transport system substrate-binding protein [Amycolatopsis bartoniae]|uniref:ABC transporter substrate-binding protein n=1 Tax=Amycolatopsis bartoniae TaxID=941986 RepID=UPI001605DCF8|nr:ABC transporter substrate-binding protein [Amycolatopsis bartoniae]MBB2935318.1 peptide/nickel transport system substrate-binding protein [Amycolatopsis bartoniae]